MAHRPHLIAGLAGLGVLAAAGLVVAQTAPPAAPRPAAAQPTVPAPAPAATATPAAGASEEAPPSVVAPLAPAVAPAVQASEVAPAAPPKGQVVEKPTESTLKRARYDVAILQALDKVTAETVRFEAAVGQPVRYKTLVFTVKACAQSAEDEPQEDSIAYMTIDSQPRPVAGKPAPAGRQVFKGWMYASSPALNPLQHPVYDAWLITCRAATPVSTGSR